MRSQRISLVVLLVSLLLGSVGGASVGLGGPPAVAKTPTHTVVITATNGSGSYTITASTGLHLKRGEQNDHQLRGPRMSGTVGKSGDPKDVIQYRGYIESFQAEDAIRVTLNGQQITPTVLAGQHIRISRPSNTSQPVDYRFAVTGQVSHGELTEQNDTATSSRGRGRVHDTPDSFYFTGTITNDSITLSGPATVMINGQNASVFISHPPPTPPAPTPTVTKRPTTRQPTATAPVTPPTAPRPAPTTESPLKEPTPTTTTVTQPPRSTDTRQTDGEPIIPMWIIVGLAIAAILSFRYINN